MQYDVAICGGGIAGLTLARQLRREVPDATVALIDPLCRPLPEACHKVGESTVELASHYLATVLGLNDYLRSSHLIKNGLRFFPGGGELPVASRTEIGPPELPIVPSFQLDRGRLENDLRAMNEADGVTLFEGHKVVDVRLGPEETEHELELHTPSGHATLRARWIVDATGRRQLLSRKLGLRRRTGHDARAAWFRVAERIDVAELVPKEEERWHARDPHHHRWLSTVHFMGEGYWVWLIPLGSGYTSVGVVVDASIHAFDDIRTDDRLRAWIRRHEPALSERLDGVAAEDFRCLREYSYTAKQVFSKDRWALVGEASSFLDPFYSPGSDYVALANCFVSRLVSADLAGHDEEIEVLNGWFLRLFDEAVVTFQHMMPCFGNPTVMTGKIYWDNLQYWSFFCQYFMQGAYRLPLDEQRAVLEEGAEFSEQHRRAQALFRAWHALSPEASPDPKHVTLPPIPSLLANAYLDLQNKVEPSALRPLLARKRQLTEKVLAELVLRALRDLPVDAGSALVERLGIPRWGLPFDDRRLALDDLSARERRRALPAVSKDLERCFGKPRPRSDVRCWEDLYRERLELPQALSESG
ncbi:MAG: NAD(P)/FAD-dependent oxidoreductase [Myxococcota bacterium]